MDACARLNEREGWKTLEVQGEGDERRLDIEKVKGWSHRDTPNRSFLHAKAEEKTSR